MENRQKQRARNARKAGKTIGETRIVNPDAIDLREVMGYLWPKIALDGSHHGQNRTNPGMVERISADTTRGREKHGDVDAVAKIKHFTQQINL